MSDDFPDRLLRDWPVGERASAFELGNLIEAPSSRLIELATIKAFGHNSAGWWDCDLTTDALTWTAGVYGIFGFPREARITRAEAVARYSEDSRAKMERLRAYSIATGKGFVLDVRIEPADGASARAMRLIGSPVVEDGRTVRLEGLKYLLEEPPDLIVPAIIPPSIS